MNQSLAHRFIETLILPNPGVISSCFQGRAVGHQHQSYLGWIVDAAGLNNLMGQKRPDPVVVVAPLGEGRQATKVLDS